MSEERDFIPEIHQYCDRWCEKCSFIYRCEYYYNQKKSENITDRNFAAGISDDENVEFWTKLNSNLGEAYEMLKKIAMEHDIDIADIEKEANIVIDGDEVTEEMYSEVPAGDFFEDESGLSKEEIKKVDSHPLIMLCDEFEELTAAWFLSSDSLLDKKEKEINDIINMEIADSPDGYYVREINDSFDTINWYNYFIQAKFRRALCSKAGYGGKVDKDDAKGSAKIALMAIDKVIKAWMKILDFVPETEDSILSILVQLSKIRAKAGRTFPGARKFIRPGLDKP